ncbi:MAG: Holliday junction branch migration protein RuvA [Nitrosomonadales bacterium]|jgi:Holliday junction DNA helicase RuvA|nr:MAG: ATP-dependent DNA helicase RuvA [Methylophilales bacterium BACL14 MAG-120920-bin58]MBT6392924.1 Holliday junction branch migration protein RuvA [Nitrosomonadales bacterium]|tara:strand:+ start:163 stop:744 length:582 start_codon:yes stop_codon:yes gene_type:complete
MIGRIKGYLLEKTPPLILLDCQGVGYEIEVPMTTFFDLPDVGSEITLLTHLIIREDAHLLFGFATAAERQMFRQLIKVNGIGAKVALSILSSIGSSELAYAIEHDDINMLVKIPGIGKKTAERLVLELKDRLKNLNINPLVKKHATHIEDIENALISLGYSAKDASMAIKLLPDNISINDGIRQALKSLSNNA